MNIKLSIILPIYNVKRYLERCVDSILSQEYKNYEVILVDDGATDGSGELCDIIAEKDPKIQVIHKENGGLSSARNAGFNASTGEYIFWIDSDDWIADGALMTIVDAIQREKPDILKFSYYRNSNKIIPFNSSVEAGAYTNTHKEVMLEKAFEDVTQFGFTAWSHVYRKEFLSKNGLEFVSERKVGSEDFLYNFQAYISADKIYVIPDCLYYYDLRMGSLSQHYRSNIYQLFTQLYIELEKWISCNGLEKQYGHRAAKFYVGRMYGCISTEYHDFQDHPMAVGRQNVKKIMKTPQFRQALRCVLLTEKNKKKFIEAVLCYCGCESLIYHIYTRKRK